MKKRFDPSWRIVVALLLLFAMDYEAALRLLHKPRKIEMHAQGNA